MPKRDGNGIIFGSLSAADDGAERTTSRARAGELQHDRPTIVWQPRRRRFSPVERAHYTLRGRATDHRPISCRQRGRLAESFAGGISSSLTGRNHFVGSLAGGHLTDGPTLLPPADVTKPGWRPPNPDDGPRPLGDRQLLTMDASYNVLESVPQQGKAAPAHMLNPDAGSSQDRIFPVKQFFDFVDCTKGGN